MNLFCALLLAVASSQEETREVRVYLIDRTTPDRDFKDAVAVLTIERPSGRGRSFLLPRAAGPADAAETTGLIRGVPGTPYFVEMNTAETPAKAEGESKAREILRRVHQGASFRQKVPASLLSEPFTATITIRLGNLTFTSEEFQGPRSKDDDLQDVASRVDRSLGTLRERALKLEGFMDLRPAVVDLIRDLARLSPAGFEDLSGSFERDRQWCLAQARAIEKACYEGDTTRIAELTQACGPRLKEMKTVLAREKRPETPPEPEVK